MHSLVHRGVCQPHRTLPHSSRSDSVVAHAIRARWLLDIKYGSKSDAQSLLQEWHRDVGGQAGLTQTNTRLSSGAIGVNETRLEMEVTFDSMDGWEEFLGKIPFPLHKAWVQRISSMVVNDGTPRWEVYRTVPLLDPSSSATSASSITGASKAKEPRIAPPAPSSISPSPQAAPQPSSNSGLLIIEDSAASDVVLDWKGDPMTINPLDKLPFKFL